jgi:hypothetical protein
MIGRAITDDAAVADLYVLIFDSNGYLIGRQYTAGNPTTVTVSNARVANNCTVYAFANTHSATYFNGITSLSLLTNFLSTHYFTITAPADLGNQNNLWMMGKKTGVNITSGTTNISDLKLYRFQTKIRFTINCASNIHVSAYQLQSVPLKCAMTETEPTANASGTTYGFFDKVSLPTEQSTVTATYYMLPNYAGTSAKSTSFDTRCKAYAPTTPNYFPSLLRVWIHGDGWRSIADIYLGGTTATDYSNYNVYRNTFYDYTINVNGRGLGNMNVTFNDQPDIGDYYYSDGTWGPLAQKGIRTPIGVIFSNTPTPNNTLHNWTHGIALALTDANTNRVAWDSGGDPTNYTNLGSILDDGYTNTHYIKANKTVSTGSHQAFYYALNYGVTSGTTTYAAPSKGNNSGWYLPCWGEWFDVLKNLGGYFPDYTKDYTTYATTKWFTVNGSTSKLNNYFTQSGAGGAALQIDEYNVSTIYTNGAENQYVGVLFLNWSGVSVPLGGNQDRATERRIRAAIAF